MQNNDDSLKIKVLSGLLWKFSERIGARLVSFIISLILARMLSPDDYGLISLIMIFINLADIFVSCGFGTALVQRKDADELDFCSIFYFGTVMAVLLYLGLFLAAPWIASFFHNAQLSLLLRVMGVRLLFSGLNTVQNAYVDKSMQFKRYFFSNIAGTVLSGILALWMAFAGFGVWSLIAQYVVQAFVGMAVLWFTVRWRPRLLFSLRRLKALFSYSWKLLVSSLIETAYNELRITVIGRLYTASDLAYYTKGRSFPILINDNLITTINSVLFPALSSQQSDLEKTKSMTRRSIKTTAYLIFPIMIGLAVTAEPLILLLLTEKWSAAVPYMQIFCIYFVLTPIQEANLQAIKALGRSDIILKLNILKKAIGILILVVVMRFGVLAIALSNLVTGGLFLVLNLAPNRKLLNYKFREQLADILPYAGMSILMAAAAYPLRWLQLSSLPTLALQALVGGGVYLLLSIVCKVDSFQYILKALRQILPGAKSRSSK